MSRKTVYQEKKRLGLCTSCPNVAEAGKASCKKCLDDNVERNRRKVKSGLCVSCSKPREDISKTHCIACTQKHAAYMVARRQNFIKTITEIIKHKSNLHLLI